MDKIIEQARQFINSGYRIFPLYPFKKDKCLCGDERCNAAGKHPIISAWNKVPVWSGEQMDTMIEVGEFSHGFGILTDKLLVVDIDKRNGGDEADLPEDLQAGLVVATGSGDGSTHHFFTMPEEIATHKSLKEYPGIDFICSSKYFVVGAESKHKSGGRYKIIEGSVDEIEQAPQWLIDLIKKQDRIRIKDDESGFVDISNDELKDCVFSIPNYDDRDTWLNVGMGIHNAIGEDGFKLWSDWSKQSVKFEIKDQYKVWDSFSDNANPITFATLKHLAYQNGWREPVTFDMDIDESIPQPTTESSNGLPFKVDDLDMLRPPGFVGEVTDFINSQCMYPRERLAVATAISAVGDIVGLRAVLDDGMTRANTIFFCVAGSSSGKEAVLQSKFELLKTAGIAQVQLGKWKSEQEIIKNLLRHDQSSYVIDELGIQLAKISNAIKRGGAVYLEGVIGEIMSIYSKSLGTYFISGDLKEDAKANIAAQIKDINRRASNGELDNEEATRKTDELKADKSSIDSGIINPFLSIIGFTTPSTFEKTLNFDNLTNGFLARALIVDETDTNPRRKHRFRRPEMPQALKSALRSLHSPGDYNTEASRRIKAPHKLTTIDSTDEAIRFIDGVYEFQFNAAELEKEKTGFEVVWRRLEEMVNRISLVLAAPSGLRTGDHVRWAFEYCRRNCQRKIELAKSSGDKEINTGLADQLLNRILTIVDDQGETLGTILNRCRKFKKADVIKGLDVLVGKGQLSIEEGRHKGNKKPFKKYCRIY